MILDGVAMTRELYGQAVDPREHLVRLYPKVAGVVPPLDHVVLNATPLVARVNHGHWIASCGCGARGVPTPGCVVFFDGPGALLGWCARCGNGATGRGWRPIQAPTPEQRASIEAVLLCRPNVQDRNWEPGETVADLVAQNREHGDPVPELGRAPAGPVHGPDSWEMVAPFSPLPQAAVSRVRGLLRRLAGRE